MTVDTTFKCMVGGKSKYLRVEVKPTVTTPTFLKDGDIIVYAIPPSVDIIDTGINDRHHYR